MRGILPYLLGFLAVFLVAYYGVLVPRNLRFILTAENLQIRGDLFYRRTIPRSKLNIEQAQLIPSDGEGALRVTLRLNGVGLPNYQSGWFRTNFGKTLLFRRPARQAIAIPVEEAYTLIVTPADPGQFLRALHTPQTNLTEPLAP
jgi:hypothetical protein